MSAIDPIQALQCVAWYERTAKLIEPRPEPLNLTPEEIVAFLDEHEVGVSWKSASEQTLRIVTLTSDSFPTTKGKTLREAVCLAAARLQEENE